MYAGRLPGLLTFRQYFLSNLQKKISRKLFLFDMPVMFVIRVLHHLMNIDVPILCLCSGLFSVFIFVHSLVPYPCSIMKIIKHFFK